MEYEILREGSAGPSVELLQLALKRAGYMREEPDGAFGSRTESAVRNFQSDNGLASDGVVGKNTWAALTPYLTGYVRHAAKSGDTLYNLSKRYNTSLLSVETANPSLDPFNLPVGSVITIPLGFDVIPGGVSFTPTLLKLTVEGLAARYPFIKTGVIGKSVMGRDIPYLKIGSGGNHVFYNASHHANEWITTPVLMRFLEEYAFACSRDGALFGYRAKLLYELTTLYIVPMVNPDGVALVTGELNSGAYYLDAAAIAGRYPSIAFPSGWKANIRGVDLNLQYPAGWDRAREIKFAQGFTSPAPRDYVGRFPLEAPESRAVYDFTLTRGFTITLSYHTQGKVIYWKYSDYNPANSYEIALKFSAVSGYAPELTPPESSYAGYKDWFIEEYNRPGYTIEAGHGAAPLPIAQLGEIYNDNLGILALALTATLWS